VEFRIDEIRHAQWAEHAHASSRGARQAESAPMSKSRRKPRHRRKRCNSRLPEQKAEIVVANTLELRQRASIPARRARNCPANANRPTRGNALNRWFIERARERKKGSR
jgi:hypothetical protein